MKQELIDNSFIFNFYWSIVVYNVVLVSTVHQSESLCVNIYHHFSGLPSHLGQNRALSRVPCAIQEVLIS